MYYCFIYFLVCWTEHQNCVLLWVNFQKKKQNNSRLDLIIDVFQWFYISKCQFYFILVIVCDCSKTNRQTLIEKGVLRQVNILSNYILSMADFKEIRVGYLQLYLEILIKGNTDNPHVLFNIKLNQQRRSCKDRSVNFVSRLEIYCVKLGWNHFKIQLYCEHA